MLATVNVVRFVPRTGHIPIATPRPVAMVRQLVRADGPVAIYQSAGCCDGPLPLCLLADDLGQGPNDVLLGHVEDQPHRAVSRPGRNP